MKLALMLLLAVRTYYPVSISDLAADCGRVYPQIAVRGAEGWADDYGRGDLSAGREAWWLGGSAPFGGLEMMYLVDIDGTLADLSDRLHFIQQKPADWDGFFAACPADKPIQEVIDTVRMLAASGARLVLVTGRSNAVEEPTMDWLREHKVPYLCMYMRKAGDHREDSVIKAELLAEILEDWDNEPILGVFEDRKQVVDMYRSKGLRVFQVAEGNF